MKKIISLLLAMIMVFSLATVAFAADVNGNDVAANMDVKTTFTKEYKVLSGIAPDEIFGFNVAYKSFINQDGVEATATSNPTVTLGTATFANDMAVGTYTATVDVMISNYTDCALGVYTYEITEVDNNIAGVNYVADPVYLNVTILRDENDDKHYVAAIHYETVDGAKTGETTNTYEAGILEVTKKTTGNMADVTKQFPISITFTPESDDAFKDVNVAQITNDNATTSREYTYVENDDGTVTVTFTLADAQAAYFYNIPLGTTYTVQETALYGYTQVSATGEEVDEDAVITEDEKSVTSRIVSGVFDESNGQDSAEFVNELKTNVDTGIALDSAPYFVILAVAMFGMVALVSKKRYEV